MRTFRFAADTNVPDFNANFLRWVNRRPGRVATAMREEMRSLLRTVMTITPPKTRAQGRAALLRDIGRAVRPLRVRNFTGRHAWAKAMRKAINERDNETAQTLLRRTKGPLSKAEVVPFTKEVHRRARDRRFRVHRWTGRMTTEADEWDAYALRMRGRIGEAKGGWANGLIAMGGTTSQWARAHAYAGDFVDALKDSSAPYIQATNRSTWAKAGDDNRTMRNALRIRARVLGDKIAKAEAIAA
jgi:hypothetical protein